MIIWSSRGRPEAAEAGCRKLPGGAGERPRSDIERLEAPWQRRCPPDAAGSHEREAFARKLAESDGRSVKNEGLGILCPRRSTHQN